MPSPATVITEQSLSRYPQLRPFLDSNPPEVGLLNGDNCESTYKLKLTNGLLQDYSLPQILSLYGKTLHIDALGLTDIQKNAAVTASNYLAIQDSAQNGHLATIKYLETHLSEQEQKEAVMASNYLAIRNAARNGHLATIKYLETHLSEQEKIEAVTENNYSAIRHAAYKGQLATIKYLETHLTREEKKAAVKVLDYSEIQYSAKAGHLDTIKYLETYLSEQETKAAVMAGDYGAIRYAAHNGHLGIIQYLETHLTPREKKEAVTSINYWTIQEAVKNDQLDIIKYLETHLNGEEKKGAVMALDYTALKYAARNGYLHIIYHFLQYTNALNYIERHDYEYGHKFTYSFVDKSINELKVEKETFESDTPNGVYNVSEAKAPQCFYLLRNLIRRGVARDALPAERREDDIRFLLSIPAVRSLCHQVVTVDNNSPGEENELLNLAINMRNEAATAILMQLPEVRRPAEQNNFYRDNTRGDMDLRRMVEDRESSMVALSQSEQLLLEKVKLHYKLMIDEKDGVDGVILEFKTWLKTEYDKRPAMINTPLSGNEHAGKGMLLPFEWEKLQALKTQLTEAQYQGALKAYYADDVHTAYRYLSKPNHWMHPGASYVQVNPDNTSERWSTFEEYRSIIAPFYLAAFDESTPASDGYTLESRKTLFVKELALIGRAHNWDTRNTEGQEYDDQGADKPSCFSGVKRRLWQSVLGHPMFQGLNKETLQQELVAFTHQHFKACLTHGNVFMVQKAFNRVIGIEDYVTVDEEGAQSVKTASALATPASDLTLLASFNITEERIINLRDSLNAKYSGKLTSAPEFLAQLNGFFQLKEENMHLHMMLSSGGESIVNAIFDALTLVDVAASGFFKSDRARGTDDKRDGAGARLRRIAS